MTEIDPFETFSAVQACHLQRVSSVAQYMSSKPIKIMVACSALAIANGCTTVSIPTKSININSEILLGSWTLTTVGSEKVTRAISLSFARDGSLGGSVRCNSLSGRYRINPPFVVFDKSIIITVAGCHPNWPANKRIVERAEQILFRNPPPPAYVSADGQQLYFRGQEPLQFVRIR
jgi:heat shock protein HslJ